VADDTRLVVLVHGWSVRNTDTYGALAQRLKREAQRNPDLRLDVRHIWLGKYISFHNEVRLEDVARAFQNALSDAIGKELRAGRRFVCITHSTGGPVVRDWWNRFYLEQPAVGPCPMSHLIMLAPANFGSALAQPGKSRPSRLKSWFEGVQPGIGVLDWLELGSPESWDLNMKWIKSPNAADGPAPVFLFVLTGQSIDRKLYDHLNSYTDESGSDGVVRTASANINARYIKLVQDQPVDASGEILPKTSLRLEQSARAPRTAFTLIPGRSHSGEEMGIMRSVRDDAADHPTVTAILSCLRVSTPDDYLKLCDQFEKQRASVRDKERIEQPSSWLRVPGSSPYFHDTHSMVVFRIRDDRGYVIGDFDLTLLASPGKRAASPDLLPKGFFVDRQKNTRDGGSLTYYFSYDAMAGWTPKKSEERYRDKLPGTSKVGMELAAKPDDGFVHYVPAMLEASREVLDQFFNADETTLIEVVLKRVVREGVFQLTQKPPPEDFTDQPGGKPIAS
jgi:hypothetical protein